MRSTRDTHRIVIQNVEYRWHARGDDGYISIGIWPANNVGPYIGGSLRYRLGKGKAPTLLEHAGQIVVTNRIVRRVIEHALGEHAYDPGVKGEDLYLGVLDDVIRWDDAIRRQ
jgi:hypothetical protein